MLNLNSVCSGNDPVFYKYPTLLLTKFDTPLVGCEMGVAYGGGIEEIGKMWKGRGVIHGFDTFEGHPTQLAVTDNSDAAHAMDPHYAAHGKDILSYEYQRGELDRQGLDNVILHKGLIGENSLNGIPNLHYALLDMDLYVSMQIGWNLVKDKMVPGGYLCLHDVLPNGYLYGLYGLYQGIIKTGLYKVVEEIEKYHFAVLEKI